MHFRLMHERSQDTVGLARYQNINGVENINVAPLSLRAGPTVVAGAILDYMRESLRQANESQGKLVLDNYDEEKKLVVAAERNQETDDAVHAFMRACAERQVKPNDADK